MTEAETSTASANRPLAVLQVLPRLDSGGVERGTVEVAAALAAAGNLAVVASAGGPMVREIERAGGVHVKLPLASKNPLVIFANIRRLVEVIHRHNIDIVHARSRAPAWSARAAARRTGKHFVTTFHNAYDAKARLKRRYNAVMATGERVIATLIVRNMDPATASGELGIMLDPAYLGRGLGRRILGLVLRHRSS